jgi:hypothetical protein
VTEAADAFMGIFGFKRVEGGMKTDRELLELAARAVGIVPTGFGAHGVATGKNGPCLTGFWNPLASDGDALRLAVKMHFDIQFYWNGCDDQYDEVCAYTHGAKKDASEQIGFYLSGGQIDELAATRRAIVRAAAAIGEQMA